jgi:hypothetical protein
MSYSSVVGGNELLRWFGQVPTFHDAEIISLSLNRTGTSELRLHAWIMTNDVDPRGYIVLDKHAVVSFTFTDIMDLQLDGFSRQNVIAGLVLQRATDRGRAGYYALPEEEGDTEIELLPCYGLDGFIRAKKIEIAFVSGRPQKK